MNDTTRPYATGEFVAQHLEDRASGEEIPEERIQPNGVDLTISEVYRTQGEAAFYGNGDYDKPRRIKMQPRDPPGNTRSPYYKLVRGQYPIVYGEKIQIPEGYVGRVYPRSRLMRSGLHLTSALWDQGYEGVGEGLLRVPISVERVHIDVTVPIAQMVFIEAAEADAYDGTHQRERVETSTEQSVTQTQEQSVEVSLGDD